MSYSNESICTELNEVSDYWEEYHHTGLCLFNKTPLVDDGLLTCENDFRVLGCEKTYRLFEKVRKIIR